MIQTARVVFPSCKVQYSTSEHYDYYFVMFLISLNRIKSNRSSVVVVVSCRHANRPRAASQPGFNYTE